MMNRVAAQGLYALAFAATVEMMRQTAGVQHPRGSTALAITLKLLTAQALSPEGNHK